MHGATLHASAAPVLPAAVPVAARQLLGKALSACMHEAIHHSMQFGMRALLSKHYNPRTTPRLTTPNCCLSSVKRVPRALRMYG